jgi:hypothetical protein
MADFENRMIKAEQNAKASCNLPKSRFSKYPEAHSSPRAGKTDCLYDLPP